MLGESEAITERSQWKKMKSFFDRDTRYKAVESSTQREEWFKEYANEKSNQTDPEQEKQERIQARSVNTYCTIPSIIIVHFFTENGCLCGIGRIFNVGEIQTALGCISHSHTHMHAYTHTQRSNL